MEDPARGEIVVFYAHPSRLSLEAEEVATSLMSEEERTRHRSFRFARHRAEYAATRALVRSVLSLFRPTAPESWRFVAGPYGRPEVTPSCEVAFNLANNPTLVVCAVARPCELGVDVEPWGSAAAILEVAKSVFAPRELDALARLDPAARADQAVSRWTAKEAYVKARGAGMSLPLDAFAIRFDGDGRSPSLELLRAIDSDEPWAIRMLDVEDHRIATAARGLEVPPGEVRVRVEPADAIVARVLESRAQRR